MAVVDVPQADYYETLGIPRTADANTIKRAFHTLVREWHPDIADAPDAEARFRALAEAYSVLSKPEARRLYDKYGYRGHGNDALREIPWDETLTDTMRGSNVDIDLELRDFEAERGSRPTVTFHVQTACPDCLDADAEDGCERCGGSRVVEVERRLRVHTPPGLDDGAQLRVAGEGNHASSDGIPGDLLIRVHVLLPPRDPRAVRYVALALLLVAVVALALYLMR
jgi:DnaJ-class molecular chaperone